MLEQYTNQPHIRLKIMREALAITRTDFAKILNVCYRRYSRWENRDILIPIEAQRIMIRLGLNPHYILGDSNLTLNNLPFETVKKSILRELFNRSKTE